MRRSPEEQFAPRLPFEKPQRPAPARGNGHGEPQPRTCSLRIRVLDFRRAMRPFIRLVGPPFHREVLLSVVGADLEISAGDLAVRLPAEGSWVGEVRVLPHFLLRAAMDPGTRGTVTLAVENDRLQIGRLSTHCRMQNAWRSGIPVPNDLDFLQALRLREIHTKDQLDRAGLGWVVAQAEWRWSEMIGKAAAALAPLGITMDELDGMLRKSFGRKPAI